MKSYVLTLSNIHFRKQGKVWTSDPIDLYDNSSYTNYSTMRSKYGHNYLGDSTFIGNQIMQGATPTLADSVLSTEFGEVIEDQDFYLNYVYPTGTEQGSFLIYDLVEENGYFVLTPSNKTTPLERFVDTTSRVDLVAYKGAFVNAPSSIPIEYTLQVYESDDVLESATPFWMPNDVSTQTEFLFIQRSKRFIKIQVEFFTELPDAVFDTSNYLVSNQAVDENGFLIYDTPLSLTDQMIGSLTAQEIGNIDFLLLVEIQISEPNPPNITDSTMDILKKFPSWTKLFEDSLPDATPTFAIPESFGGKFINALIGDSLDSVESLIDYFSLAKSITGADTEQLTWIYSTSNCPSLVTSVKGDNIRLAPITTYADFIKHRVEDYVYYHEPNDRVILTLRPFNQIKINELVKTQTEVLVFNMFDEFGSRVGLPRLKMEANENYKTRILDVYKNLPGPDIDSFKKTIRRELDLWRATGATPNSDSAGATPIVLEMENLEELNKYFEDNNNPTKAFIDFVEKINIEYPTNWGFVPWSEMIWDYAGKFQEGVKKVPFSYDKKPIALEATPRYVQNGIGDLSDLKVSIRSKREFSSDEVILNDISDEQVYDKAFKIKLAGIEKVGESNVRPPINFDFDTQLQYTYNILNQNTATVKFLVELVVSGVTYYANYTVNTVSDIYTAGPLYSIFNMATSRTNSDVQFKSKTTNVDYLDSTSTTGSKTIHISNVTEARVSFGQFVYSSTTPLYTVSGHSASNSGWIHPKGHATAKYYTTSYANASNASLPSPYYTITTPTISKMQIEYGSSMVSSTPSTGYTSPVRSSGALRPYNTSSGNATPSFDISFNSLFNLATGFPPTQSAPVYNALVITNVVPEDAYIDPDYSTPGYGYGRYGGYVNHPQFDINYFVPGLMIGSNIGAPQFFSTPSYSLSSPPTTLSVSWDPYAVPSNRKYSLNGVTKNNYPLTVGQWEYFEKTSATPVYFRLSERGVIKSEEDIGASYELSDSISALDVHRFSFNFDLATPNKYIVNNISAEPVNPLDDSFEVWTDKSSVIPYYSISEDDDLKVPNTMYVPSDSYSEIKQGTDNDIYIPSVVVKSRLNTKHNKDFESEIHTGWYYLNNQETYVYARPVTENVTYTSATPYYQIVLSGHAKQGAPVILESLSNPSTSLTQVSFIDAATPSVFSSFNTEYLEARKNNYLYVGYKNIYEVSVYDPITELYLLQNGSSNTEKITLSAGSMVAGRTYTVKYKVKNTYSIDNEYLDSNNKLKTKILFHATPITGDTNYAITYESTLFDSSTPSGVYHSPMKSLLSEGFVYLTDSVYEYDRFLAETNPGYLIDDPASDYSILTIESYDKNGNPKPYQKYNISSNLLSVQPSSVETDNNGFAYARVAYSGATPAIVNNAPLYISGVQSGYSTANDSATLNYSIVKSQSSLDTLHAEVDPQIIKADGVSTLSIKGILSSKTKDTSSVRVYYRLGRTLHSAITNPVYNSVISSEDGSFAIGPITARSAATPGYWFGVVETEFSPNNQSSPVTISGDIVHWFEDSQDAILNSSGRVLSIQDTFTASDFSFMSSTPVYKINYLTGNPAQKSATPNIVLPKWFKIPRLTQYQMGILGSDYYSLDNNRQIYPS